MNTIYGKLTIYIYCIGLQGVAVVTSRKAVATAQSVSRAEAELIKAEHSKQAYEQQSANAYEYVWHANPDVL